MARPTSRIGSRSGSTFSAKNAAQPPSAGPAGMASATRPSISPVSS